jgi:hypothetical protein
MRKDELNARTRSEIFKRGRSVDFITLAGVDD